MTTLAVVGIIIGLLAAGAFVGLLVSSLASAAANAERCHECPDRRCVEAMLNWRDGTDD